MATQSISRGKVTKHGIEVPSALTYKSWEPGGEYTKPLVLKNVHLTSKKIRYKMPQSQIFSTIFPQPIVLGSGTSHTLPITFKPLEKRVVADNIEILTNDGSFTVPLRAILPTPNLSLPSSLQFGMCAVSDNITMEFNLTNITDLPTNFQWEVPAPFRVTPHYGLIKPRGVCKLQASFHPEAVSVFEGAGVCYYGDSQNYKKPVKLEGIGKYPHLVVSTGGKSPPTTDLSLSFGDSPVGETVVKCLYITNVSSVSASFDITTTIPNMVFSCSEYTGTISPEQVYRIKVMFQPQLVGSCSGHFTIKPRGGVSDITIKCVGRGQGADVEITESYVNFGNIACGTSSAHMIPIKNNSQRVKAVYQFQMITANGGVFTTEGSSGVVNPGSTNSLLIHFTPTRPIPYHKKLVCIVHHMSQPVTIDLIGTGYTETTRPTVLLGKHLSIYNDRVETGLSRYSPEQLQQLITTGKLKEEGSSLLVTESFSEVLEKPPALDCSYGGYLSESHDPTSHHVTTDTTQLEFDVQITENKVNITNHTMGKLYCIWTTGANSVFSVIPEERELVAGACCSFTVTFSPCNPNQYYYSVMDCYICYKSMREQQDNDRIITVPWCISVRARGNSFMSSSEPYLPRALFTPRCVVMPSSSVGHEVHQTLVMTNNGNSPIAYDFQQHSDYTIHPSHGLLEDNHQVFIISARCDQSINNQHVVKAVLNGSDKYNEDLLLHIMVDSPQVSLEHDGTLYFMPTCIQCSQTNMLVVTNTTCLQLDYYWRLLGDCTTDLLNVIPTSGTLLPYESQTHLWSFTPADIIMYKLEAQLVAASTVNPSQKCKSLLKITGQGELGHLKADPSNVELSTVVVGCSTTSDIIIQNVASCQLSFCLSTSLHVLHLDCSHSNADNPAGVELSVDEDSIPAGGRKVIRVKMRPCVRGRHTLTVIYQLNLPRDDHVVKETICSISFDAVYPTMTVTGLLGQGSLGHLNKPRLWSMFSIDKFNKLLQQDPSPSELRYALKTRYSTRRKAAVHTTAIVEVTFGASPVDHPASSIQLQVENMGNTPTQWAFQFPEDIFLEPAYWADTGELDQVEKDEMRIMDNDVFSVHPKSGHLDPGSTTIITLSFRHVHCGSSRLPVLLKIGGGREVLLFFHGVTVPTGQPYVMFTSYHHHFSTIPVGCHAFPQQVYELYNGGDKMVKYSIDTAPLDQLQQENYGVSVIDCLQPVGEVPARSSTAIEFVFSPQEVKTYIVELPIQFDQHKTVLVSLTGRGYDPSQLELPDVDDTSLAVATSNSQDVVTTNGSSLLTINQAVTLSHETVSFGHLPLFSTVSRIIFLRNNTSHTVSWKLPSDNSQQVLTFSPSSGYLQPMDTTMCRIVFFSQSAPQLYHFTIVCELMDETAVMSYKEQLEVWKEKEEERQHLFTITDDLKKYQALPPIGQSPQLDYEQWNKLDLSVKPKTRPRTKKQSKSPPSQPKPPEPFYLQLTITATTHAVSDYCQQFDDFHLFFIDRQAVTMDTHPNTASEIVSTEEKQMVTSITTLMLKDLLSDGNFTDAVRSITEEPLPFFMQYTQRNRNTGGQAHARHSYAAALEHISKDQQLTGHVMPHDEGHDDMTSEGYNISQKTGDTTVEHSSTSSITSVVKSAQLHTNTTEQLIMLEDSIKHLPDFHGLVEDVLNGTILNIVQETITGEASITKLLPTIATP
ncbi:cilia- and flagella-associated protein 65-like [Dysidea avara]|uniref:cilia- and flagella-associated protein 65-like n=1 Tax=Dysidea avara TaxID=196820 RepID=UPI00332FDC41